MGPIRGLCCDPADSSVLWAAERYAIKRLELADEWDEDDDTASANTGTTAVNNNNNNNGQAIGSAADAPLRSKAWLGRCMAAVSSSLLIPPELIRLIVGYVHRSIGMIRNINAAIQGMSITGIFPMPNGRLSVLLDHFSNEPNVGEMVVINPLTAPKPTLSRLRIIVPGTNVDSSSGGSTASTKPCLLSSAVVIEQPPSAAAAVGATVLAVSRSDRHMGVWRLLCFSLPASIAAASAPFR